MGRSFAFPKRKCTSKLLRKKCTSKLFQKEGFTESWLVDLCNICIWEKLEVGTWNCHFFHFLDDAVFFFLFLDFESTMYMSKSLGSQVAGNVELMLNLSVISGDDLSSNVYIKYLSCIHFKVGGSRL